MKTQAGPKLKRLGPGLYSCGTYRVVSVVYPSTGRTWWYFIDDADPDAGVHDHYLTKRAAVAAMAFDMDTD